MFLFYLLFYAKCFLFRLLCLSWTSFFVAFYSCFPCVFLILLLICSIVVCFEAIVKFSFIWHSFRNACVFVSNTFLYYFKSCFLSVLKNKTKLTSCISWLVGCFPVAGLCFGGKMHTYVHTYNTELNARLGIRSSVFWANL